MDDSKIHSLSELYTRMEALVHDLGICPGDAWNEFREIQDALLRLVAKYQKYERQANDAQETIPFDPETMEIRTDETVVYKEPPPKQANEAQSLSDQIRDATDEYGCISTEDAKRILGDKLDEVNQHFKNNHPSFQSPDDFTELTEDVTFETVELKPAPVEEAEFSWRAIPTPFLHDQTRQVIYCSICQKDLPWETDTDSHEHEPPKKRGNEWL